MSLKIILVNKFLSVIDEPFAVCKTVTPWFELVFKIL